MHRKKTRLENSCRQGSLLILPDLRPLTSDLSFPATFTVLPEAAGQRLDRFLTGALPSFSRAAIQRAIDAGHVHVEGAPAKSSLRLKTDWVISVNQLDVPRAGPAPQDIALDIVHEDDAIIVVNKPAGMIVHPAKGHWDGTLASALAHHFGPLSNRGGPTRPGIVHRLDRDTSGLIVVAKNDQAHDTLSAQFKSRQVEKEYLAIVVGVPDRDQDIIDEPIGDHPTMRERKAIRRGHPTSREAATVYEVVERFSGYALVRARPKTGRTHQIRLHFTHIGCPVLCDRLYGGRSEITELELIPRDKIEQYKLSTDRHEVRPLLARHALHAHRLALTHPTTGERLQFETPPPADIQNTLASLRRWRGIQ